MSTSQPRIRDLWMSTWLALTPFVASGAPADVTRMERAIDQRVSTNQFMGSVLVTRNYKVLIDKGYGFADLATKTPNGPQTKFRLGSVTNTRRSNRTLPTHQRVAQRCGARAPV